MELRALRQEELELWAIHCATVFTGVGDKVDPGYFIRHYQNDPTRDLSGIFVAVDGAEIAATVRLFSRKVWLLGAEIPMGGIGEVSTKTAYRNQGLAGKLLEMALEKMRQDGMAVSLLFSKSHSFYSRFGWEVLARPMQRFPAVSALPCEGRALKPSDLAKLAIIDEASGKPNWSVVRAGPEYWKNWISAELKKGVVAVENSQIVAWLAYEINENDWRVIEFRALPGLEHKFDGLCALAAALEGRSDQSFNAPAWLPTGSVNMQKYNETHNMAQLVCPFSAGGVHIGTTKQLLEAASECCDSSLDHF